MKVGKLLLLILVSIFAAGVLDIAYEGFHRLVLGRSSYSTEAFYSIPGTSVEIILERRAIHLFLAEYERTLVIQIGTKELIRKEVAVDTGGYSRMNVYQTSPTEYYLSGDLSFDRYFLDVAKVSFREAGLNTKPLSAKFIGAFDRDEEMGWRFISARERGEQKNKTQQSGGIQ
jgi:5-enolpyruvylshikimate-3-phosphate synthase